MSYPINDITAPLIQLDSVAIGFQLNNDGEASNINKLDLTSEEYLVVGEKTYYTDTSNTKWSLIVNSQGTSVNASRNLARNNLTHDTSLYVDKNIYCTGIIKAAGLELSNIRIDDANPITCNLIKEFIVKTNDLVVSQPFQTGYITNYSNLYDINYDVKNIFTPNYVTFGGHVDTYKNTHPLNIVSTPNNKFSSMHIAIRNDTNNSEEPSKMCMGIIGGSNTSPAIISTTKGVPLEFHVSRTSDDITMAYGTNALPTYSISNIPAMTIDAYNNVGIGTNNTTLKIYNKKSFINNITNTSELHVKSKFEVKGLSTFDDILLYDFITKTYRHLDDIYIRSSGVGVLNATQINGGDFTDPSYRFNNNLSVVNELTTKDIIINNDATIQSNLTTNFFNVLNHSRFDGTVAFNNNVDFDNVENINVNKLNITNDLFINNKRVTPLNLTDTFTGNYETVVNGSNYLFVYVSSNIASLDANCNVNFPNKLALGLTDSDGFDGILNIIKNDRSTSNNFDIFLKNKLENKEYIANIGRLSRLDYNDNSLIFNTNFVKGKKNNIYFYPSSDISILTSNRYLPNLKNTPPTLSLLDGKVGINKLIPDNLLSLDVNGAMAANDYYISQNNSFKRTKNFAYNNDKNFFNLYDTSTEKFCINYNELLSFASDMRGLNVKKGINADLYYQNNILLETLQKASSEDSFYTNKNISIGWNGEQNVAPLQVRNLFTNDYNYSTIRIYRGLRGGGLFNNADYSGIDICEYDRDIEQDRNKEKWFIYKNHKYNDLDARNYMRVGPLQIGYTDKTIEPTSYGMSFYYDTATSKYHIDVNNPKVSYEDKSAMTIYGDLNVHGNINILDNEGCNYNFTMKLLSSNLQRVDRYINYISNAGDSGEGYDKSGDKIEMSFDILRSRENLVIDPLKNSKTPVIIKNMNDDNPVTKFITYSKSNICYSMIELAIYNSNLQILDDSIDKNNNVKNAVQISLGGNNNSNTTLDFNVYNNDAYKNFLRFTSKVSDNGDANSTIAHFGLGTDKSSNILLHIDGNEKYGLQITNNQYPASINLLNSEGPNVYHNISGGEFHNNYKFNIGVSSSNNGLNEPILTNVFTIDAFKYDAEKRRGARFGFNEDFKSNTTQSFVLNTDYDTVAMGIRSRYSYEYMFNSTARINYDYVSIDPISSNWNNNNKVYYSLYKQNILELPPKDDSNNPIISSNVTDDFIFKTNNTISNKLSYITVHSNINYPYLFSNLNINLSLNIPLNVSSDILRDDFILRKEDTYNLLPNNIFYSSNDDIKPTDITQKSHTVNNTTLFNVDNSDILFNYTYINKYNLPKNISSNIDLINYSNFQSIGNSNYFNISNYIITTLSTQDIPFNQSQNSYEHVYIDFNQTKVNIKVAANIVNSNNYINTYTKNILKYNSNIFYDGVFFSAHKNELNIITSNIIFDNFFDKNTAYLKITSNIIDANNIIIRASNYSINNNVNSLPRNMIIKRLSSNIISDSFDILGNTINNNLIIEEYISDYSNVNIKNFSIGIRNYNYKNYKPHISLINDVERNNNLFEGHEIYSYDGIFEIKYSNSKNNQLVPLKIDKEGTMFLEGGLDMKGNLRFDGRIYDANGNDLIEILNKNYYKEYEINSSNIHFNALGSNGVEINSYATSNYSNYKFFYVKDMLAINSNIYTNEVTNIFNDILVLHKSELLYHKYNLDLYTDLYVHSNVYIEGYGNRTSFSVLQKENANIIEASNLNREVLTLAYDGSMGLGVTEPQSVLLNIKQHIIGSNVISASNFEREILTLAYDGSMGLGVTEPQSVLFNIKQNIIGSNVISASNLGREILTLAYDGSMGLGVTEPQSVLLNIKQNIIGSNVISASNLGREILTLAYDGSMGLGVTEPLGVLLNIKQNIIGSNVISASNLGREILTLAYDGSMGLGVTEPQGVLLNIKQNIIGCNVISASNLERETLTLAYDGSMGLGVTEPLGVLLNIKQNIIGSNVISASNLGREILTLAYDGSMGLGVTEPQSVLLNIKQNIIGSNVISASNLEREILTLAYDGSMGMGVTEPLGVLLNIKQNIIGSNVISASNLNNEIMTLTYDGIMGIGVTNPNKQSKLDVRGNINIVNDTGIEYIYTIDNRDIIKDTSNYVLNTSNIISKRITDLTTDVITEKIDAVNKFIVNNKYDNNLYVNGNLTINSNLIVYGETTILNTDVYTTEQLIITNTGEGDAMIVKQINNSYNIFTASNNNIPVFNINCDGRIGVKTENPQVILEINSTDGIKIPTGTDIQRPVGIDMKGTIRYNTDTQQFEGYGAGDKWGILGGVKDINNDTYISAEVFPGSNNDELRFYTGNIEKMIIKQDGKVGIGTQNPKLFFEVNSSDGIKLPVGSDIQRPTGDNILGTIRYNTDTKQFEGYGSTNTWGSLGGLKDVNNDTFISTENSPGSNDDELRFYTSNIEKMIIKKDGRVGIGKDDPFYLLDVSGDIRTTSNLFVNLNVGIGTTNIAGSLLNIYGKSANVKIQNPDINNPISSIEFINGTGDSIDKNDFYGWKMLNSNNNFSIVSGSNSIVKDTLIIHGESGNIGVGTYPHTIMDSNTDIYKIHVNGSINIEGDIYRQGVLFLHETTASGTARNVGVISQHMPIQTQTKTYSITKSYLNSEVDNDDGWRFIDNNINNGFVIKIKPSHKTSKILINLSMHIGIDSSPESIWWGIRLYRKIIDNDQQIVSDWKEVVESRPKDDLDNNEEKATPCWISHSLGANLTSYENFVANVSGSFSDIPDARYTVYYTAKWKTNLGNSDSGNANIYLNRPAKYNSRNSSILSSSWTATEIWQLGTPYMPTEGSNVITIYDRDYVGIGNTQPQYILDVTGDIRTTSNLLVNLNVGIGTTDVSDSLLNIYGKSANIKIQDPDINDPVSSIEFINGVNNSIQSNISYGWKMFNSNNNYIISSGSNNIIKHRLIIDGESGNIGIGTDPHIIRDSNDDFYKMNINGSINVEGDIYRQGVLLSQIIGASGTSSSVGIISQNMPVQTLSKTYSNTKSYLDSEIDNDNGWRFVDDNINNGFLIKIKPSHRTSKILINLSMHIGIDSSPDSIWWGARLYRKIVDNNQNIMQDWHEVIASRPVENSIDNATPCWLSHTLGANLTSYENFVANINGTFFDRPDTVYTTYYTIKWKTDLGNNYGESANIYLNRPAKYNSSNSPVLSSTWTVTEIWQLGTPYMPTEGSNVITIYNQDYVGIGNTEPLYSLDVSGDIRASSNLIVNLNVGIGTTSVSDSLLNIYGKRANIKIQDPDINEPISSIEFINGINNSIDSNNYYGWKMYNSNNNYTISSGNNGAIHDRFIIEGSSGNIGVGTIPNHKLDINGIINAKAFNINGSPFVLEFTQGMTIQTIHKTYSKTLEKQSNSIGWIPIDNGNDGFLVKIKPSHIKSKVLVSMTCHIGMDYSEDSRWWGLQLYRKIGDSGEWSPLNNANGTNSGGLECSPCWISHNLGADNSMYSHSIINVSGSYEDEPNTTSNIYYTAYWKSKLDNTEGKLYINRPAYINSSNYPLTSSSWTASEIWNNGTPYKPTTTTIAIAYDKVGIGMTPSISSGYKLEVNGDFKCRDIQCLSVTQTSDSRYKKNIEGIDSVLENINKLNPISYLTLDQNNTDKKSYGFIAQEINELFPDIVNEPKNINELYAINYTSIIPLLTKSIQELTKKIEMQQQEINYLKQKL